MLAKNVHPDFNRERLSTHFVYESYDKESELFFNRGSIGFVLIGNLLPGTEMTAETEIAEFIANKNNLPDGCSIQISIIGSSDISFLLNRWKSVRVGDVFKELAEKRCEFLEKKAKSEGNIKDSYLVISVTFPDIKSDLLLIENCRNTLKSTLQSIGLRTDNVDDIVLLKILHKIWDTDLIHEPEINPYMSLSEQILPGNFCLSEKKEIVDLKNNTSFVCLEAKERPNQWRLSLMDLFLGNEDRREEYILTDYIIHVGIHILRKQTTAKAGVFAKREAISRDVRAGLGKWFPELIEELGDVDSAVKDLQNNNRVVHIHTNVILKGQKEKIEGAAQQYTSMMRRNGWNFVATAWDHLFVMICSMPMAMVEEGEKVGMGLSLMGRGKRTISSESKALMPIIGEFKGDLTAPGLLLTGRRGQVKYFSQFGSEFVSGLGKSSGDLENYNICIAGVSGSGKSVLMQEIMLSVLGVGGKVFVLDYGKSFKNLCQVLGGTYIEFDPTKPISINPFSDVPTGHDEASVAIRADFFATFPLTLATMAAPKFGTNDLQQSNLSFALRECWDLKNVNTQIDDIADFLLSTKDNQVANDLGKMLFEYTSKGAYGGFFQGKSEVNLKSDIVVIETDHLRNSPDLMAVVTQIMTSHINNTIAKGRSNKPNLLVFEEIVKTLEGVYSQKFVDKSSRIVRKYRTSIMVATQLLTDFIKLGEHAQSIFEGASFKIIMKQNTDTLTAMSGIPLLKSYVDGEYRMNRLRSIRSSRGKYSEFSLWAPGINGDICQLRIDPFTLLLMSTNPTDRDQIAQKRKLGLNLIEAINLILKERGQGEVK